MTPTEYANRVEQHVRGFFVGHGISVRGFDRGPIQQIEALETLFDAAALEYWNPDRDSVI